MSDPEAILRAYIGKGRRRVALRTPPPRVSDAELRRQLRELMALTEPCPFCGKPPRLGPTDPEAEGSAWGFVRCETASCAVRPQVEDGSNQADERGSAAYIALAIKRWNRRP